MVVLVGCYGYVMVRVCWLCVGLPAVMAIVMLLRLVGCMITVEEVMVMVTLLWLVGCYGHG